MDGGATTSGTSLIARLSFTSKLIALAAAVLVALVAIDYVALLELPRRIASDTVEIALRENVQALNATIRDDREQLEDLTDPFIKREDVRLAIDAGDEAALGRLTQSLGRDVRFRLLEGRRVDGTGVGSVAVVFQVRRQYVAFYRPVDDALLDRAAEAAGNQVSFAIEENDAYVARSSTYPSSLRAGDVDGSLDPNFAEVTEVRVGGEPLHLYSRAVTADTSYQLHALSTPELETEALGAIRSDVRTAIIGMTLATVAAFLMLAWFTNRSVGGFGARVRALADGDYGTRLEVRGRDAFADLAGSVNRLSVQLSDQLGQLESTAEAFRQTLETLEEGICAWDPDGSVRYWNRGAEQLTGLARERIGGATDDRVVEFLRAERTPGTRRVTLPVRRSGAGLVVDLVVTAMADGGVLQTFRDTTLVDMLQQTQRNFMATASHELRTPITAILGFADTLANPELELTERQRDEFVSIIREQAHQLQQIAEAFFTNQQLANERVEVSIAPTQLHAAVVDALERARRSVPDRATDLEGVVVHVPADVVALADHRALVGVISVLLENAVKYGGAPITVGAERSGGTVALLVHDTGPGIDPFHQGRIFDPFYRIDVDMRSGIGGAGLGLFTARKLVEAMQGTVRVRSTPGAGSTFAVELPAAPGDAGTRDEDGPRPSGLRLVG